MMTDETTVQFLRNRGFDAFAGSYDRYARIQQTAGLRLCELMEGYVDDINGYPIVELGAGTGIVSDHLKRLFPASDLIVSDISPAMLEILNHKYATSDSMHVQYIDANRADASMSISKAIVCAFTIQWLDNPASSITDWLNTIPVGSYCFVTWPGEKSFPEWKHMAEVSCVPYTGNKLPGATLVDAVLEDENVSLVYHTAEDIQLEFDSSIDFFKSIRDIGAGLELHDPIANRNLLRLIRMWDMHDREAVTVTHRIHTLVLKKL